MGGQGCELPNYLGGAADHGAGSGHHAAGMMGSVAKAAALHVKGVGEDSVDKPTGDKPTGLAGLLPTAEQEKPPAER